MLKGAFYFFLKASSMLGFSFSFFFNRGMGNEQIGRDLRTAMPCGNGAGGADGDSSGGCGTAMPYGRVCESRLRMALPCGNGAGMGLCGRLCPAGRVPGTGLRAAVADGYAVWEGCRGLADLDGNQGIPPHFEVTDLSEDESVRSLSDRIDGGVLGAQVFARAMRC